MHNITEFLCIIFQKVITRYLDFEVVRKLNYFPFKGALSLYYSPQTIVHQQYLENNKHFTTAFGAFFQENNDNNLTYSNVLWEIDGIYL